jgi:hypothetical protein
LWSELAKQIGSLQAWVELKLYCSM